ncbi:hypothetical protein JXA85_01670, partial [Candidatus Woesearchaeota archaeon]|nr:hypothetical protein [Candidatus Woesearchaeota archaeon]
GTFLPSSSASSYIAYSSRLGYATGYANGCFNNTILGYNASNWNTWQNITGGTKYSICGNLTANITANSVGVYVMVGVPQDATTGHSNVTFQFTGSNTG